MSYENKNRDAFIKELDRKYKELVLRFSEEHDNGSISDEQFEQDKLQAKRVWLIRRKEADSYYANKDGEDDTNS